MGGWKEMSLYFCNPRKNETCPGGRACQTLCFLTTNPEYSDDGIELTEDDLGNLEVHRLALAGGRELTDEDMIDDRFGEYSELKRKAAAWDKVLEYAKEAADVGYTRIRIEFIERLEGGEDMGGWKEEC